MTTQDQQRPDHWYAERSMTWYWGSPIGLGAFFISLGAFIVLLSHAGIWR
jgi:hypothetical protein